MNKITRTFLSVLTALGLSGCSEKSSDGGYYSSAQDPNSASNFKKLEDVVDKRSKAEMEAITKLTAKVEQLQAEVAELKKGSLGKERKSKNVTPEKP